MAQFTFSRISTMAKRQLKAAESQNNRPREPQSALREDHKDPRPAVTSTAPPPSESLHLQPLEGRRGSTSCAKTAPVFLRCGRNKESGRCSKAKPPSVSAGSHSKGRLFPSHPHEEELKSRPASPVQSVLRTAAHVDCLQRDFREKRKQGNGSGQRLPKRLRCSADVEAEASDCMISISANNPTINEFKRNKLSRSHRRHKKAEGLKGCINKSHCEWTDGPELDNQEIQDTDTVPTVSHYEDCLWTDQYSPQEARGVIGNSSLVGWLKKWKARADRDERRIVEERKPVKSSDDCWDCGDFQGEAGSEEDIAGQLFNTLLITGPVGVGKTTSVYACAQELGFKVFEVNCSSQRSGHHVLSQLKEATQSHLVETAGKEHLKPYFISNYSSNSCTGKSHAVLGKEGLPKKGTLTIKKRRAQSLNKIKGTPPAAAGSLTNYFKMKAKADHFHFGGLEPACKPDCGPVLNRAVTVSQKKRVATSLILFEEVDVIFDEDVGFLAAIKSFMTTTKRPVVLTTNDPFFKERFDGRLEEITFKTPSPVNVCSFLQRVLLAEKVPVESEDIRCLLTLTGGDIRRCLLQLQLCLRGHRSISIFGSINSIATDVEKGTAWPLVSGCSAGMLGLHPVTVHHLVNLLKCQFWNESEQAELLMLLAESWRRHVPLLYANFRLLLDALTTSIEHRILDYQQLDPPISSRISSCKSVRNVSRLSRKKKITSLKTTVQLEGDCLDAVADFFDLLSYLDAMQPGSRTAEGFLWTGAELKDGMLDEMSEEEDGRSWNQERMQLDIQAAVEGFGCHRCWWRVCEVWTEALNSRAALENKTWRRLVERLSLAATSKSLNLSFSFQPLCAVSICQRRYKLIKEILRSKAFIGMGNKRAVCVDYMPLLRFICCSQTAPSQTQEACRPLNYLSSLQLGLSQSVMERLTEDFSERKLTFT